MRRHVVLAWIAAFIVIGFMIVFFGRERGVHHNVKTLPAPAHDSATQQ